MARYIDASLFGDTVDTLETVEGTENAVYVYDVIQALYDAPVADVQEVRHGKWDEIRDAYGHLEGWIHRDCGRMSMAKEKYCPTCGAKMDGGKSDEQ